MNNVGGRLTGRCARSAAAALTWKTKRLVLFWDFSEFKTYLH